jgi:hypothetical protein
MQSGIFCSSELPKPQSSSPVLRVWLDGVEPRKSARFRQRLNLDAFLLFLEMSECLNLISCRWTSWKKNREVVAEAVAFGGFDVGNDRNKQSPAAPHDFVRIRTVPIQPAVLQNGTLFVGPYFIDLASNVSLLCTGRRLVTTLNSRADLACPAMIPENSNS